MRILAIDIGGTNTKIAIFNRDRNMESGFPVEVKTITPIENLLEEIFKKYRSQFDKTGISIAANVNNKGLVVNATNLSVEKNFDLKGFVEKISEKECRVVNDGNASAIAVKNMEEFKNFSNIVSATLGTGIGGGIIIDGKILQSKTGLEAEIGHIQIEKEGEKCNCGNYGCLEVYCGEKGIVRRFNKVSDKKISSTVELKNLADRGNKNAVKIIGETGIYLGRAFAMLTNALAIEVFVLGGGVCGLGNPLIETIQSYLRNNCFGSKLGIYPKVKVLKDYKYLSLKGAAELFYE